LFPGPVWSWFSSPFPQPGREPSALGPVVGGGGEEGGGAACGGGLVVVGAGDADCVWVVGVDGAGVGLGVGVGVGVGCVGGGGGEGFGGGVVTASGVGVEETGLERAPPGRAEMTCRALRCGAPVRSRGVTRAGGIRTTGGAGAGTTTRGVAARRSLGELDSNAARQRYPEVTPAATSRQSRSASNEIRTRMSIDLPEDSIGAKRALR
jgi:hypothetical protein